MWCRRLERAPDVDQGEPGTLRPIGFALSQRLDGQGMVCAGTLDPAGQARRSSARGRHPAVIGGLLYVLKLATPGGSCPRIFRPRARCTAISSCGPRTVRWSVFTTPCMSRCASRKATRPARRPQFSTARAPNRRKRPYEATDSRAPVGFGVPHPRPHARRSTGRPVSQYAGNEGCVCEAGAEPHA